MAALDTDSEGTLAGESALPDRAQSKPGALKEFWLEVLPSILMALAVVLTAYSAYEATRWNGVQATHFAEAGSLRAQSTSLTAVGVTQVAYDANTFAEVAIAFREADFANPAVYQEARRYAEALMRDEAIPALEEWLQLNPQANPDAPATPLEMDSYTNANLDEASRLVAGAEGKFNDAKLANQYGDEYVLATIFFAAVLFFTGIKVSRDSTRSLVVGFAAFCLLAGIVRISTLPFE